LYDRDALLEGIELFHAGVAANADDLVAAIQGVLHHVLPELSGSPYCEHERLSRAR